MAASAQARWRGFVERRRIAREIGDELDELPEPISPAGSPRCGPSLAGSAGGDALGGDTDSAGSDGDSFQRPRTQSGRRFVRDDQLRAPILSAKLARYRRPSQGSMQGSRRESDARRAPNCAPSRRPTLGEPHEPQRRETLQDPHSHERRDTEGGVQIGLAPPDLSSRGLAAHDGRVGGQEASRRASRAVSFAPEVVAALTTTPSADSHSYSSSAVWLPGAISMLEASGASLRIPAPRLYLASSSIPTHAFYRSDRASRTLLIPRPTLRFACRFVSSGVGGDSSRRSEGPCQMWVPARTMVSLPLQLDLWNEELPQGSALAADNLDYRFPKSPRADSQIRRRQSSALHRTFARQTTPGRLTQSSDASSASSSVGARSRQASSLAVHQVSSLAKAREAVDDPIQLTWGGPTGCSGPRASSRSASASHASRMLACTHSHRLESSRRASREHLLARADCGGVPACPRALSRGASTLGAAAALVSSLVGGGGGDAGGGGGGGGGGGADGAASKPPVKSSYVAALQRARERQKKLRQQQSQEAVELAGPDSSVAAVVVDHEALTQRPRQCSHV